VLLTNNGELGFASQSGALVTMERAIDYRRLLGAALVNREFAGVARAEAAGLGLASVEPKASKPPAQARANYRAATKPSCS
jgi:hypothetical protein